MTFKNLSSDIIKDLVKIIDDSNSITVFTGAGVSVNSGIPDFRGPKGLYKTIQTKFNLPFPEAIFEINYFKANPKPFFELSKELFNNEVKPTKFHNYIAYLESKDKVNLIMTQNIDMLHQKAGSKKVIECHGSYLTAHCLKCNKEYKFSEYEKNLKEGSVPYCSCKGVIKPDIVFFGESLPEFFFNVYYKPPNADLLIVAGSSLTVQPAASFALNFLQKTRSILINLEETIYDSLFDYVFNIDIDEFVKKIWDKLPSF